MKKQYAICRTRKIKAWSTLSKSIGHNLRTSNDTRSHLAKDHPEPIRVLAGDFDWMKKWKKEVKQMWLPDLKQGDRHTLAREFFLGASPEYFKGKSKKEIEEWGQANLLWLYDRFGSERVKLAVMHLDEQTPHIAAYVVPLKRDANRKGVVNTARGNGWTLSDNGALQLGGSKNDLVLLQDQYAEAMADFGLQRGERHSKATHQTISEWQREMAVKDEPIKMPKPIAPTIKDRFNIEDYGKRVARAAATEIYRTMKPSWTKAKRVKALEKQARKQAAKIEHQEMVNRVCKEALEKVLGIKVSFDSVDGIEALQRAVMQASPQTNKKKKNLERLSIHPVSQMAWPEAVERPRVRHGSP